VRTAGDPAAFATTLRREVQAIDKDQPVYNVRTMDDVVFRIDPETTTGRATVES